MNRLKHIYYIMTALLLGFTSCNNETDIENKLPDDCNPIALKGIHAVIDNGETPTTRVAALVDSIGKYKFMATDRIYFTKIERTKHPIDGFKYDDVEYACNIDGENLSWKREVPTTDIFWSDGSEPHTFIGYILPHEDTKTWQESGYDWNHDTDKDVYYGSIGDPTNASEEIDYTDTPATGTGHAAPYDLEKLRKEDLLLTYSNEMQNEDALAWVHFHHGLASVRVVVTITGYSSTGIDPDAEAKVTEMMLHDQPTMYKWNNKGYKAAPLEAGDQIILNRFTWGGTTPAWNQTKDMKLWQPREYRGTEASRTFTFYGITAPGEQEEVNMTFKVKYPNPLDPTNTNFIEKPYTAKLKLNSKNVEFRPGYCTSININLNHKDEKLTVGAEYMSWQFEDTPDEGTLRKNSTFLEKAPAFIKGKDKNIVSIIGDTKAETIDDATWLYVAGKDADGNDIIKDIYGNDGSATHPYHICTANQLLSFAYEVKNGRSFVHQYVKLDADITLQPTKDVAEGKRISWIGVGDETNVFNGFFLGSGRYINSLYGEHFFSTVGENAVIDKLNFEKVIEVQGCGVIAHKNLGLICGCYIDGDVKETNTESLYTGSIVGENDSFIIACAHVGTVSGRKTIGGLVGFNNGTVMASYHCGEIVALDGSTDIHATVGKRGDGTGGTNNSIMFSCYYDETLITHTPTLVPSKSGFPFSTGMMQSNAFVNTDKQFLFDADGKYTSQGKTLREVLLDILGSSVVDKGQTEQELMQILVNDGLTGRVNEVFANHFSLNEALYAFRIWLNAIAAKGDDLVHTNCHDFTKLQIQFLKQHYTTEHQFVYTPATYPKVQ